MNEVLENNAGVSILAHAGLPEQVSADWFDPAWWRRHGAVRAELGGRGQALLIDAPIGALVLRRFQRGGFVARFSADRYCWLGRERSRSFREFRLLEQLYQSGLPVPMPIAASVEREGLTYRAGLLTRLIPQARQLAELASDLTNEQWHELSVTLESFFAAGLWHPDLNARNLLLDSSDRWHLLDLDRARLVTDKVDHKSMRRRLARSLEKLAPPGWRAGFNATLGQDL